jgi:putative ABC transport system substrate-binding protein
MMIKRGAWVLALCLLSAGAWAQSAKRVMIITNRGCEEVCLGFQRYVESQGPVQFIVRDADGDVRKVADFVAEARKTRPDLIATWGTGITLATVGPIGAVDPARHLTDIPVVYMYVGNPVASKIAIDTERSGRPNLAGANTAVPLDAQLNVLSAYREIKTVGMLYNTDEPAAVSQAAEARVAMEKRGFKVIEEKLADALARGTDAPAIITPALKRLADAKPDFIYYVGSTFTLRYIDPISEGAVALGIPMFTAQEPSYRAGDILIGLISPLPGVGQIAGYQAAQILFHDKPAGSLVSPTLTRHSVLINMKAARALKLYPPMKLLQFAEVSE